MVIHKNSPLGKRIADKRATPHTPGLSFDGKGINDKRDQYAPRVATFKDAESAEAFGNLFAAAPDMMKALEGVLHHNAGVKYPFQFPPLLIKQVLDAVNKAKGE